MGDGTVVGARSSVFSDLPEWVVATGTPARPTGERRLRVSENDEGDASTPES